MLDDEAKTNLAETQRRDARAIARDEIALGETERLAALEKVSAQSRPKMPDELRAALEDERSRLNARRDEHQREIEAIHQKLGGVNSQLKALARGEADSVLRHVGPLVARRIGREDWERLVLEARTLAEGGAAIPAMPKGKPNAARPSNAREDTR
jgi:hypothetical protein